MENITLDLSIWCTNSTSMYSPRLTSVCQPQISLSADQWHLASTRIPLRSALFHCSEWWPLIPTESTLSASSFSAQQSLDTVPTQVTSSNASSTALVFFQKVPSMEYIGAYINQRLSYCFIVQVWQFSIFLLLQVLTI